MEQSNALYKDKYGDWAGNTAGSKPDFKRCCEEVSDYSTGWPRYHQCSKPRGHGPGLAYCKIHDPAAKKAREEKSQRKHDIESNKWRTERFSSRFLAVLRQIAEGHNDPRTIAKEVIAEYESGLKKVD